MSANLLNKLFARTLLVASLLLAAYVYYLKYPTFHQWVDTNVLKRTAQDQQSVSQPDSSPTPAPVSVAKQPEAPAAIPEAAPSVAAAAATPRSTTVDLAQLSQSRTEWPKTLTLKKETEFPAVMDGKVVGNVKVPEGTQVALVIIKDGKVGVEYNGGGTMVDAADTNLTEEVLAARAK